MKRRCIAFSVMLLLALSVKLVMPALAEIPSGTQDEYTREYTACEGRDGPVGAVIALRAQPEEALETVKKEFVFVTDTSKGETARAVIGYRTADNHLTDEEWDEVSGFVSGALSKAIPKAAQMDAGEMAERALEEILRGTRRASFSLFGSIPAYAREGVILERIEIKAPYYPELTRGSRGEDVLRLQNRLIELGYLTDRADGQFGKITAAAIEEVQTELRAREQKAIDEETERTAAGDQDSAVSPSPAVQEQPATQVTGAADQAFQIRLYSEEFPLTHSTLDKGADAQAVTRLQRRLIALGCLMGEADGDYGANTRRGVTLFQHYNNLDETGVADESVQRKIFSSAAQAPDHPLLTEGSSGDEVKKLQQRLIALGFMKGTSADGDYGNATRLAVENLQTYLKDLADKAPVLPEGVVSARPDETAAPASSAFMPSAAISVNGIADPLLLDDFYAPDFPAIPSLQKNGDSGGDVTRIQRRLWALEYVYAAPDGNYGSGTESAIRDFQKRAGLSQDGVAGSETLKRLFSLDAPKALKPYVLKVSIDDQRVYAYGLDENNQHTILVRTMVCSTGRSGNGTPKGTYQASTCPGARWHYFKKFGCWAQYAYYIEGDIMFHSVLYGQKNGAVTRSSVRNLGSRASHGCVRLSVEDAKWIYDHCPQYTKVIVY